MRVTSFTLVLKFFLRNALSPNRKLNTSENVVEIFLRYFFAAFVVLAKSRFFTLFKSATFISILRRFTIIQRTPSSPGSFVLGGGNINLTINAWHRRTDEEIIGGEEGRNLTLVRCNEGPLSS